MPPNGAITVSELPFRYGVQRLDLEGAYMTPPITKPVDELVREQFESFEMQERNIRIEERNERAAQLKLPLEWLRRASR